jgi:hypothetical protein
LVHRRGEASKQRLARLLDSSTPPALLFASGHGLGFAPSHELQRADQGALLCEHYWHGRGPLPLFRLSDLPISRRRYYSGQDVPLGADLMGMIGVLYSSYSTGTPRVDHFLQALLDAPSPSAPEAFVARLPQQLLARGAGAVVGLTDRAWGYSFFPPGQQAGELAIFQSSLRRLLGGDPVGYAFQYFKERYAELATMLTSELEDISFGLPSDVAVLARMSTAMNDAFRLTILGDPAVRLPARPPLSPAPASAHSY